MIEGCEQLFVEWNALASDPSCNFQPCYFGQRLFSHSHDYLLNRGFVLLNLDYKGFGYPRLGLFRKPDPIENEDHGYGILVAADAVSIRNPEAIDTLFSGEAAAIARLKLSAFCFFNNAPDLAIDLMRESSEAGALTGRIVATRLYKMLRLKAARFLGRYRTVPDEQWERAAGFSNPFL